MSEPDPDTESELVALAATLRRVVTQVRTIAAPVDVLVDATERLAAVEALLDAHTAPGPYCQSSLTFAPGNMDTYNGSAGLPNDFFPYSPVLGARNPISPPMEMWMEDEVMHGRGTVGPTWCGPPYSVHGGGVAMLLDELLGSTLVALEMGAPTGTLKVIYRSFTPLDEELTMRAWLDRVEGRKRFVRGEIRHGDRLCAEAEGIFIQTDKMGIKPASER